MDKKTVEFLREVVGVRFGRIWLTALDCKTDGDVEVSAYIDLYMDEEPRVFFEIGNDMIIFSLSQTQLEQFCQLIYAFQDIEKG